jgi:hypothetical protein
MLNYQIHNLKKVLTPIDGEQTLLTRNNDLKQVIVVDGYVCNLDPNLSAFFSLILYNTSTLDSVYLYKNIEINIEDHLKIERIILDENQILKCSISFGENPTENSQVNLTINYFEIQDYEHGFIRVTFLQPLAFNQQVSNPLPYYPRWRIIATPTWYEGDLYIPLEKGQYSIEFSGNEGYDTPNYIIVNIESMKVTQIDVSYKINYAVVIFQCDQIDLLNDFGWKIVGWENYYGHNQYVVVEPGIRTVTFKNILNVNKPLDQIIDVVAKKIYRYTIKYERYKGFLTVNFTNPYIKIGKVHKKHHQWYLIYPSRDVSHLYQGNQKIELLPSEEEYKLVILGTINKNQCYVPEQNNIEFSIEKDEEVTLNINMIKIPC